MYSKANPNTTALTVDIMLLPASIAVPSSSSATRPQLQPYNPKALYKTPTGTTPAQLQPRLALQAHHTRPPAGP